MESSILVTRDDYIARKKSKKKIVMITAYDAAFASIMDSSGAIDVILVGDSLGMAVQGQNTTQKVRMEHMVYHTEIVARTAPSIPVIADLPYLAFEDPDEALKNAKALTAVGAKGVKIEGDKPEVVRRITSAGIPLIGHLGLLPQTARNFKVQGKDKADAERIVQEALDLQDCGAAAIVLECVPRSLAASISEALEIPTIGIGAGPDCDGQVLVVHDMLGLSSGHTAKFVKKYTDLHSTVRGALVEYADEVRKGSYPSDAHSYH